MNGLQDVRSSAKIGVQFLGRKVVVAPAIVRLLVATNAVFVAHCLSVVVVVEGRGGGGTMAAFVSCCGGGLWWC